MREKVQRECERRLEDGGGGIEGREFRVSRLEEA
jgi:hypothetical protein